MATLSSSPVGSWYIQSASGHEAVFTFMSDGTYFLAESGTADIAGQSGMEKGAYTWNSATGALTVTTSVNTNGEWGFSHPLPNATQNLLVSGDSATLVSSTDGNFPLTRVASSNNTLIGSWYIQLASGHEAVFTFMSDGTYFLAESGTADIAGQSGMEKGAYTWNSATGALTVTTSVNTNGEWGFSHPLPNATQNLLVSGDSATLVSSTDGNFPLIRVASGNNTLASGNVTLVSSDASGVIGNALSKSRSLSANGRYAVFESDATNLVAGDTNGARDAFLKDTLTGAITLLSADAAGVQGNAATYGFDISADGRYATMMSNASNLVAGDTNGLADVFIKDTQTGAVTRVNADAAGAQATGGTLGSDIFDISAAGRYAVFGSDATNLVAGDTNGIWDVFLKDTQTGAITRVSTAADGTQADIGSYDLGGKVTEDGAYVVFNSDATNLVTGDTNGIVDVFMKNIATGAITRVSTATDGTQADSGGVNTTNGGSDPQNFLGGISADGRYVVFMSGANNLVAGDTNGVDDIFLKDTQTGAITRVNTNATGNEANGASSISGRALSADGRYVVFSSSATNLTAGDTNGLRDVFVKDTQTGAIARVNLGAAGVEAAGGNSSAARISADGSAIAFNTSATNLVSGDTNGVQDAVAVANPFMLAGSTLTGSSGNDTLTGSTGIDTFIVEAGTDTLADAVPGTDIINISSGATAVQSLTIATASYATNTTNNGTLVIYALSTTASTITGSSGVDVITGSSADDSLDGGIGNDTLNGGAGNDVIEGGLGADTMDGGAGNDTYYVDSAGDSVVETGNSTLGFRLALNLGGNIDKVISSISYTLGDFLENLDLASGSGNLAGTGNALDNVLTGNEGNNTLTGGGGNDSLDGGAGIDTAGYAGNRASFTLAQSGTGFTVTDNTSTLGTDTLANLERLAFADTHVALDVTGGNAGTTAKILGAVFGAASVSNKTYVGIGLNYLDGGMSYADLMALALNAAGAATSNAIVTLLWTNLFGSAPTAAEAAPYVAMLDSGSYSAGALGVAAANHSLNTANINLTGLAQTGIEYI